MCIIFSWLFKPIWILKFYLKNLIKGLSASEVSYSTFFCIICITNYCSGLPCIYLKMPCGENQVSKVCLEFYKCLDKPCTNSTSFQSKTVSNAVWTRTRTRTWFVKLIISFNVVKIKTNDTNYHYLFERAIQKKCVTILKRQIIDDLNEVNVFQAF